MRTRVLETRFQKNDAELQVTQSGILPCLIVGNSDQFHAKELHHRICASPFPFLSMQLCL
jgi:hypothetical protein